MNLGGELGRTSHLTQPSQVQSGRNFTAIVTPTPMTLTIMNQIKNAQENGPRNLAATAEPSTIAAIIITSDKVPSGAHLGLPPPPEAHGCTDNCDDRKYLPKGPVPSRRPIWIEKCEITNCEPEYTADCRFDEIRYLGHERRFLFGAGKRFTCEPFRAGMVSIAPQRSLFDPLISATIDKKIRRSCRSTSEQPPIFA